VSEAGSASIRVRVNAARVAQPARRSPWPWHDRSGHFSWLKAVMLGLQVAPAVYLAWAWASNALGPRPVTELIHGAGLMAIRFLLLSLLVSPVHALFNWPRLKQVRRQLGLTALFYALAHITLYSLDQKFVMLQVVSEIALRFYLTIGFVALLGLVALGVTSTDGMVRRLGRRWKPLHRIVYGLALLGVFHFFLQSKADVSEATLMAGVFLWLMGWRLLPAGPDRAPLPILGLGVAAALVTAAAEYAWFGLGTKIAPIRPLLAELDWSYGPHPAGQVLVLGLCVTVAVSLVWARQRERLRDTLVFDIALYAGGAMIVAGIAFTFSLADAWLPDDWSFWQAAAGFVLLAGALGVARWWLPGGRRVMDGVCAACLLAPLAVGLTL
jgi:methionine sulfoxide reductase heme-binding subunit